MKIKLILKFFLFLINFKKYQYILLLQFIFLIAYDTSNKQFSNFLFLIF